MTLFEKPEPATAIPRPNLARNPLKRGASMSRLPACAAVAGILAAGASLISVAAFAQSMPAVAGTPKGDPTRGQALYQACESCHSIDDNDIGPKHRGVVGRHAGSIQDYAYSPALKNSGLTWDEANLDRWLSNPSALVPGTRMFFKIDDAQKRADLIAYLKEQK